MSAEGSPAETKGADESRGDEILIIEDWSSRPYSVGGKPPKELAAHEELRYRKFQTLLSARVVDVGAFRRALGLCVRRPAGMGSLQRS